MSSSEIPKAGYAQIENYPLSPAPPGVVADLVHPKWHGQSVVIAASVGIPLMLIMASIRIYIKCYLTRKWILDDYTFLISLASALSLIALQVALVYGGAFGYHAWDVKIADLTKPVLMRSLVLQVATGPLTWLIKIALFSLIYNAFRPLTYIRRLVYIGLVVSGLYYIAAAIVNGVTCGPRGGNDQLSYLAGLASPSCGNPSGIIQIFSIVSGVVNFIVDLYLLIIPLRAVSVLNLPTKRKIGVFFIFLTGTGACVMSIVTLYYRSRGFSDSDTTSWKHDTTYQNISLWTVSTIEYSVGVIIPCMAPSAKAFHRTSDYVTSHLSSRFTGFRRTRSIDDSLKEERELKHLERRVLPNGQPFSQTDTIDRMLIQIPTGALQTQGEV